MTQTDTVNPPRICFVEASGQNVFFGELLDALRRAAERRGVATETAIDHFPALDDDVVYVFVPHEYAPMTLEPAHPTPDQLRRSIAICTEQPGSPWFELAVPFAREAGATLDINPLGLAELERRGIEARRLQLGYVPEWDAWHGDDEAPRPTEVAFLGGYLPRRGGVLASCGQVLQGRRVSLRLVESNRPHAAGSSQFLAGEKKWQYLASSKVLLNVHRDTNRYFEWQRVVEAMVNGCVVVTEHSLGFPPLVPGEHFVSSSTENLPFVLEAVLEDDALIARMRRSAYDFLRTELPLDTSIEVLLEAAEELSHVQVARTVQSAFRPLPRPVLPECPEWVQLLAEPAPDRRLMRMALKRMMLAQREIEKRLDRIEAETRPPTRLEVKEYGPPDGDPPRLSVVVPLHNYEQFIEEALWSVALSDYPDLELVVVDDASTDRSAAAAAEALSQFPWLKSMLLRLPENEGLPRARNTGIQYASGELIFMLDADNAVYPHAFERLVSTLDEQPDAEFAYGILEQFDASGSVDLLSMLDWNPSRLALGNYIDATALIRRSALERVGGYTTDPRLYGWEDFALWCAFADQEMNGVLVPEIVARYRTGRNSMISLTNIDTSEAWAALVDRYSFLREEAVAHG